MEVIRGDHKGARGKVLRVNSQKRVVFVEGVNIVYRHVRPTRKNPQGGRIQKEAPIALSNVAAFDSKAGRGLRARFEVEHDSAGRVLAKRRLSTAGTLLGTVRTQKDQT